MMHCMKCGKEISDGQVFCDNCLAVMAQYPVKPDTKILLPNRTAPAAVKRATNRKKTLSLEERLVRHRKVIQWLSISLATAVFALFLTASLLIDTINSKETDRVIGQNYSTADPAKDMD